MLRIRTYPHFDADLTPTEAIALVSDPQKVAEHAFFPFIEYSEGWTKFAQKGKKGTRKSRPIKYAARRDSCIFSHYREVLGDAYEQEIARRGIASAILAYRRIPKETGRGNKCNIHFAAEAFADIARLGDCFVYTFDISSFFENLDHAILKRRWKALLGLDPLPKDHYRVFRSVTRYASVNREELYRTLGYIGSKVVNNRTVIGYKQKRVPLQVCSSAVFKAKVLPLINVNKKNCGIPQGSPISDVLANLYLLEFDTAVFEEATCVGGSYRRYSDDILLIIPGRSDDWNDRLQWMQTLIAKFGGKLQIKVEKSTVHRFEHASGSGAQSCKRLYGTAGANGLEYLGFRYDGKRVFIKDATRSRLQRKMALAVKASARRLYRKNPFAGRAALKAMFKPQPILQQFYKIPEFEKKASDPKEWTFWTYAMRATRIFGEDGATIERQLRNFRRSIVVRAEKQIDKLTNLP